MSARPAARQGIALDQMETLRPGLSGLVSIPFPGQPEKPSTEVSLPVVHSALRLLSLAAAVSGSVGRTGTGGSYTLNIWGVKHLNYPIWSLLSLSTVVSILTYSCPTEEVAGFNSRLLVCQLSELSVLFIGQVKKNPNLFQLLTGVKCSSMCLLSHLEGSRHTCPPKPASFSLRFHTSYPAALQRSLLWDFRDFIPLSSRRGTSTTSMVAQMQTGSLRHFW